MVKHKVGTSSRRISRAFLALLALAWSWLVLFSTTQYALHQNLISHNHNIINNNLTPLPVISISTPKKLEFVHITKTGGSIVESVGYKHGILWGACHYISVKAVGCAAPDMNYTSPDFLSYKLQSPWHTPPKILQLYVNDVTAPFSRYPYHDADLFTVVRNPYDRVVSEYYCPWQGFHSIKYGAAYRKKHDISNKANLNWWVQDMIHRLQTALEQSHAQDFTQNKVQRKGLNEDPEILAQKHYINQAEYVFDDNGSILIPNVLHYENLSTEFHALMEKYGLGELYIPPKESRGVYTDKTGKHKLTYKDLDAKSIQVINQFARQDFEKFGYVMVENGVLGDNYSLEAKVTNL